VILSIFLDFEFGGGVSTESWGGESTPQVYYIIQRCAINFSCYNITTRKAITNGSM